MLTHMQYEQQIDIEADPDRVWAILADVERWPEWTESMTTIERLDDGPLAVGSRAQVKQPRLRPAEMEVTSLEPGRSFEWQNSAPGVTTVGDHRIEPRPGGGSTVTLVLRQTGFAAPVIRLLFGGLIRRYVEMEAQGLKRRAEEG